MALGAAAYQAIRIKKLLTDLRRSKTDATEIQCDSVSVIAIAKNPVYHGMSKHITIKHHFIRELVTVEMIKLAHCKTIEQVADVLTKSLSIQKHCQFRSKIVVSNFESRGSVEV